ncbi:helix-turn-helix domain-containing protein [Planococcus sp. A6]|uniref:response regulator transcription factor n=1 Tax=Planococcus sp. A6 TaxID=2992760 RepID=UPI00237B75D8|nr:helix-turn-helix domain-containing protein [Planococcus sp. A6]MDE0582500.1 helix-turn-helix domain-containing protein [Planococcus sp. A6]
MNILLVDDESLELEQMEYLINRNFPRWNIFKAQDASQAMKILNHEEIFLAFLDIQLPGKTGLELAKEMKDISNADIVMVTAYQSFEYAHTAIKLGVVDYITKPVIEEDLIKVLNNYSQLTHYSHQIQQSIKLIHQNYEEKITLNYLAEKIHINPAYLSRKFQEEVGIGFSEYVNNYRLMMAKKMLTDRPEASIGEISEKCGFNSQHYFSQMFRKETGLSPRDYRLKETGH